MSVKIPHLRYVVAAADHSSFRRAANALNITQPTLSKRIREVEDRLGVTLFERSTGGAELTPIGEEFVVSARRVLAELEVMQIRAKAGKRGDAGRLEIGFYTSLSTGSLRDIVLTFVKQHPDVEVNLVQGGGPDSAARSRRHRHRRGIGRTRPHRLCAYEPVAGTDHGRISERASACRARVRLLDRH